MLGENVLRRTKAANILSAREPAEARFSNAGHLGVLGRRGRREATSVSPLG